MAEMNIYTHYMRCMCNTDRQVIHVCVGSSAGL